MQTLSRLRSPRPLRIIRIAGILLPAAVAQVAVAAPPKGAVLEVWLRPANLPAVEASRRPTAAGAVKKLDLDAIGLSEVEQPDVQYEGTFHFKAVPLKKILDKAAPPESVDLALLHFANGMVVPLPFRDEALMERLRPVVARAIRIEPAKPWSVGKFPEIAKKVQGYVDVRPIRFGANKLVVADRLHPDVPEAARTTFSPWIHVDTLVGIELVQAAAYYRQFDVSPAAAVGLKIFKESCQFCHGVRRVGASYGADAVEPLPMYSERKAGNLFFHIRYRTENAPSRGLMMPALKHISEADATQLWQWLKALDEKSLVDYKP